MKRTLARIIVLSFVCVALLTCGVFAEDNYVHNNNGTFSVNYDGEAGSYYALLVVDGMYKPDVFPSISEDNVLYIDQTTADDEGNVDFENWTITDMSSPATVYVSGPATGPVLLGYLNESAKIEVEAGDTVYHQDGTVFNATEAGFCSLPYVEGIVVVNSGMESQKIYNITQDDGWQATLVATDAVVGTKLVSLRNDVEDATKSGVRFKMTHNPETKKVVTEYGFVMTVESSKVLNGAGENYTLDKAMVDAGYAKLGTAWNKSEGGNGKWFNKDDDTKWIISGVLHNIPMTKDGVTTVIASRPYAVYEDGTYIYGEITKTSLYNACKLYQSTNYAGCSADEKKFIKSIIELVEGIKDIQIDVSGLYAQN